MGKRLVIVSLPKSRTVSAPKTAIPFSTFFVCLPTFLGFSTGTNCCISSPSSSPSIISFCFFGASSTSSSSPSIIKGNFTFLARFTCFGKTGSTVLLSSTSSIKGLTDTFKSLLAFNLSIKVARSKPLSVWSIINGPFTAVTGALTISFSSSTSGTNSSSSSSTFSLATLFLGSTVFFCSPLITTATLSFSSTTGLTLNFCFNTSKGFITI